MESRGCAIAKDARWQRGGGMGDVAIGPNMRLQVTAAVRPQNLAAAAPDGVRQPVQG